MNNEDLRAYRLLGLTILQMMALLSLVGIVVTLVLGWIF